MSTNLGARSRTEQQSPQGSTKAGDGAVRASSPASGQAPGATASGGLAEAVRDHRPVRPGDHHVRRLRHLPGDHGRLLRLLPLEGLRRPDRLRRSRQLRGDLRRHRLPRRRAGTTRSSSCCRSSSRGRSRSSSPSCSIRRCAGAASSASSSSCPTSSPRSSSAPGGASCSRPPARSTTSSRTIGLGALQTNWISDPKVAIWSLMIIISWKYIGFAVILFLAGMQSIPDELHEAAAIDGASYWQIQRRITLPLLGPTIRIWAFLSIIGSLQLFDLVYIIWGQYIASTAGTSTMATYMVGERAHLRQLRLRQRRRRGHVRDLARDRPHLPALRVATRHGRRHHRKDEAMTATTLRTAPAHAPGGHATARSGEAPSPTSSPCSSSRSASDRCSTSSSAASATTPRSRPRPQGFRTRGASTTISACSPVRPSGRRSATR